MESSCDRDTNGCLPLYRVGAPLFRPVNVRREIYILLNAVTNRIRPRTSVIIFLRRDLLAKRDNLLCSGPSVSTEINYSEIYSYTNIVINRRTGNYYRMMSKQVGPLMNHR